MLYELNRQGTVSIRSSLARNFFARFRKKRMYGVTDFVRRYQV